MEPPPAKCFEFMMFALYEANTTAMVTLATLG
jgi:hypothetical protein